MVSCVVRRCGNTSAKTSKNKDGITFHRFPRDPDRRTLWEQAVNRDRWSSTPASCICSEHFPTTAFYLTENGLRRLATDAVPSINISICQEREPTISLVSRAEAEAWAGAGDSPAVVKLRHKVRRLEVIAENRKRRLNLMWQSKRRLREKLHRMTALLKQLINNK